MASALRKDMSNELVCWTRMQSEAGERLVQIVARKEAERKAGEGVFFWGVGNPPAIATADFARLKIPVQAVFSVMKSRPQKRDIAPNSVLVWRRYFDMDGIERDLPPHVLITSRGEASSGQKKRHYALMCYSKEPLTLQYGTPFDPSAFRNAGANGGPIGASQVTALVRRFKQSDQSSYEANIVAQLVGSYWVKLSDPIALKTGLIKTAEKMTANHTMGWLDAVSQIRSTVSLGELSTEQFGLL